MAWAEEAVGSENYSDLAVAGTVQSSEAAAADVLVAAANAVEPVAVAVAVAVGVVAAAVIGVGVAGGIRVALTAFSAPAAA